MPETTPNNDILNTLVALVAEVHNVLQSTLTVQKDMKHEMAVRLESVVRGTKDVKDAVKQNVISASRPYAGAQAKVAQIPDSVTKLQAGIEKLVMKQNQQSSVVSGMHNALPWRWRKNFEGVSAAANLAGGLKTAAGIRAGAGALAGTFVGGLAVAALVTALNQVAKGLKENWSPEVLGSIYANARFMEARQGRFTAGDREVDAQQYRFFRNRMRRLGLRDDAEIGALTAGVAGAGIGGTDVFGAAKSKYTIKKMFGLNVTEGQLAQMYRSTRTAPGGFMTTGAGEFTANNVFATLSRIVGATAYKGGTAGLTDMSNILLSLTDRLLDTNNNLPRLIGGLGKLSSLVAENKLNAQEAAQLIQGVNQASFPQRMNILALSGFQGNMLTESESFLRKSRSGGMFANLQMAARAALNIGRQAGGSSLERQAIVRMNLEQLGLGGLASTPDLLETLTKAAAGDSTVLKDIANKTANETQLLQNELEKLDMIQKPLEHIRDFIFGSVGPDKL